MMNEFDRCIDEWAELVAQRNATIAALEQWINDLETNLFAATATVASLEDKLATVERERDQARAVLRGLVAEIKRITFRTCLHRYICGGVDEVDSLDALLIAAHKALRKG